MIFRISFQAQIIELVKRLKADMGMAMIWITHDLGVVAGIADRVIVMYAGYIVEEALVDDLYENPLHPYTLALLQALPRADRRRDKNLKTIQGVPPNLLVEPIGCPFAPRCDFVQERCIRENPQLAHIEDTHKVACWVDPKTGALR
jgi:oligopeptide transport system ATP-binding protein